jgi:hypothetical protein
VSAKIEALVGDVPQRFEFGNVFCRETVRGTDRSHGDDATIVLDRHNVIYAYGPLDLFESTLRAPGVQPGSAREIPDPHVHHYRREWDDAEREVLRFFAWNIRPLRESDVQVGG